MGLLLIRLCLGFIGGSFVCCQYWTSCMFAKKIIGNVNALAGGWGNLGGGFTFILMPLIFKLMIFLGLSKSNAWKYAVMVPGVIVIIIALFLYKITDDCPLGDYKDLKRKETQENSLKKTALRPETWILGLQYAGCFGVELTVNNVLSLYLNEKFGLEQTTASLIGSSFGLMNIFARATGGLMSDKMSAGFGMRGRIWTLFLCLMFSGIFLILFGLQKELEIAIPMLLIASFFIQSSEGGTFSIVPYVSPKYTGMIAGIVGAGGNIGAIIWGFIFREYEDDISFIILGFIVIGISIFSLFIKIDNHHNILF
jgi:NNP family nitrate/nitrite transporter-like MFS transporter